MTSKQKTRAIDAEWTPVKRNPTRNERKRRKRAMRRDVILISLAVIIPICTAYLANYLAPPIYM